MKSNGLYHYGICKIIQVYSTNMRSTNQNNIMHVITIKHTDYGIAVLL